MKSFICFFLLFCFTFAPSAANTASFRIGVIFPSDRNDRSWCQSMYTALTSIQKKSSLAEQISISFCEDNDNELVAEESIDYYTSRNIDLVIVHGSQYKALVQKAAKKYPKTSFAWGSCSPSDTFHTPNVFTYQTATEESGYVNGIIAALVTETNFIGLIAPLESSESKKYLQGFENGAKSVSPDISVLASYTSTYQDIAMARDAAKVLIAMGADVLTGTAQQAIGALEIARENNTSWIGMQSNQNDIAIDHVIASHSYNWERMLFSMIDYRRNGIIGGKSFTLNFENGGLQMVFNEQINHKLPIQNIAQLVSQAIADGTIHPLENSSTTS